MSRPPDRLTPEWRYGKWAVTTGVDSAVLDNGWTQIVIPHDDLVETIECLIGALAYLNKGDDDG